MNPPDASASCEVITQPALALAALKGARDRVQLGCAASAGHPQVDRYVIHSAWASQKLRITASDLEGIAHPETFIQDALRALEPGPARPAEPGLPFCGGVIGLFYYEAGFWLDPAYQHLRQKASLPLVAAAQYLWALIEDKHRQVAWLVFHPQCSAAARHWIRSRLLSGVSDAPKHAFTFTLTRALAAPMPAQDYRRRVQRIIRYIQAGDCYQVNFSQCLRGLYQGSPEAAFQRVCLQHPAPFPAYLDMQDQQLLCFSPERFISVREGLVETRPIKGTRRRGLTPEDDQAQASALLASEKDRAENLMIVDLLRNDLGRFCATGSIQVTQLIQLESYSNVHHLVSVVKGRLKPEIHPLELLLGAFPGGSITGAPKRRAMEIITELEPDPRGPYCGSVFYLSADGQLDSNIVIRSMLCKAGEISCWGGGGVVFNSDPQAEYEESLTKIRGLICALEVDREI